MATVRGGRPRSADAQLSRRSAWRGHRVRQRLATSSRHEQLERAHRRPGVDVGTIVRHRRLRSVAAGGADAAARSRLLRVHRKRSELRHTVGPPWCGHSRRERGSRGDALRHGWSRDQFRVRADAPDRNSRRAARLAIRCRVERCRGRENGGGARLVQPARPWRGDSSGSLEHARGAGRIPGRRARHWPGRL